MSDNPLRSELNGLERKLVLLLSNHQKQKQEIEILKNEVKGLKSQLNEKDEVLSDFQNKDKISKIVNGVNANESNPTELGEVLDEYIKEVDKCIAQLSE
ncbi:MAG: hypothetical protein JXR07_01680 [Reichenbachiella sp.]